MALALPPFRVLGAIRTRTGQHLGLVPLPLGYEDARAFGRSRTACLSLTRRPLFQVSYEGKWLGKQESNLHKRDRLLIQSQACCRITPFPIGAGGGSRTRTSSWAHQVLSLARLPVTPRPRAPPGIRTPSPPIKSRVLHRYSSRRVVGMIGLEPASSGAPSAALQPN